MPVLCIKEKLGCPIKGHREPLDRVDSKLTDNAVFVRPALKEFRAITSIHHLDMKFSTKSGVVTIKGDQRRFKECYLNYVQKTTHRAVSNHIMMVDIEIDETMAEVVMNVEQVLVDNEMKNLEDVLVIDDDINSRITKSESQAFPMEKLKSFLSAQMVPKYSKLETTCLRK
ncbi:Uncharacterized protein Adt_03518 [Abeliophyllum distichum]|uniref:Uncharacterized protein n=1 Tax=Abeliophyllum distichum TaxID=126358 RepID=A0ABD1W217_9LAMI